MAKFDSEWIPKSAMTIFAHPDDTEFSCGGTVTKWTRGGCEITFVLCTSGNVGTHDLKYSRESLALLREQEQRNACAVLGVQHIEFLRHDDCCLVADLALRRELVRLIRKYKPEVVFCGDPSQLFWGTAASIILIIGRRGWRRSMRFFPVLRWNCFGRKKARPMRYMVSMCVI